MPRPYRQRRISATPPATVYKPAGVPARELQWVTLTLDEFEVIRLIDGLRFDQEKAAAMMGVSRPTVTRILASARAKIAQMLTTGGALAIEGGPIIHPPGPAGGGPRGRGGGGRGRGRRFRGGRGPG